RLGIQQISTISEAATGVPGSAQANNLASSTSMFWANWDSVVAEYLNQGIDLLLLARLGPYVELDISDLVRFHRVINSPLTQVYDNRGALDLVLVEAAQLREGAGSFRSRLSSLIPHRFRYRCGGYTNRLRDGADFRKLVRDALLGQCDIQPVGSEIRSGVWAGPNTRIDRSAIIDAPAFIGAGTCIGPACRITQATSVEKQCDIDAGTTVEDSCVLPGTYVGMGLSVAYSLVAGARLFHLSRNVELEFPDARLIGPKSAPRGLMPHNLLRTATSLLWRQAKNAPGAVSTRSSQTAS